VIENEGQANNDFNRKIYQDGSHRLLLCFLHYFNDIGQSPTVFQQIKIKEIIFLFHSIIFIIHFYCGRPQIFFFLQMISTVLSLRKPPLCVNKTDHETGVSVPASK